MRNDTRVAFNGYTDQLARLNNVGSTATMFAVSPTVQQTLESKIQESSGFLQQINMVGVVEKAGKKVGLGISGPAASRIDTSTKDRATRDITGLDERGYDCQKTNFDTHITYAMLDAWSKFPDFQARVRDAIVQRQALDRIMIGWNGKSIAAETNITNNPLLQDVNKGWLQKMREENPARVMAGGKVAGKVTYGGDAASDADRAAADYKNLDALVFDMVYALDPWYREDPNLRAFCGRDMMHDKLFPLVGDPKDPTQKVSADIIISQKRLGGLQAVQLPFFPAGTVLVTTFKNLSLYWQEGARRRMVVDNPKRDRIENYESSNDDYIIEQMGLASMVENIRKYGT